MMKKKDFERILKDYIAEIRPRTTYTIEAYKYRLIKIGMFLEFYECFYKEYSKKNTDIENCYKHLIIEYRDLRRKVYTDNG